VRLAPDDWLTVLPAPDDWLAVLSAPDDRLTVLFKKKIKKKSYSIKSYSQIIIQ
jgi:hypothetical protein